jgi:hypothetical protein
MTVSIASLLKGHYDTTRALGAKVISSDFAFEIEGFEANWLLAKQCPWPEISPTPCLRNGRSLNLSCQMP